MPIKKKLIGLSADEVLISMLERMRAGRSISHQKIIRDSVTYRFNSLFNQNKPTE